MVHGTAALWQAVLIGFAVVLFIWFAVTFAEQLSAGSLSIVFAAVTASLFLVTVGAYETLGEVYRHASFIGVSSGITPPLTPSTTSATARVTLRDKDKRALGWASVPE
jgi:hypothetical protein